METSTALALALATLQALPTLIKLTEEAAKLINEAIKTIKAAQAEGRDVTDAEFEHWNQIILDLRTQRDEALENRTDKDEL